MSVLKFGTDGIRDVVNEGLTPKVAYDLGCSLALFLLRCKKAPRVVLARDTRLSCDMLISGLCSGLTAYGVNCVFAGIMPTPALAFITMKNCFDAGVMVTASHNNSNYNGFKLFDSLGLKYNEISTSKIEIISQKIEKQPLKSAKSVGKIKINKKLLFKYILYLKSIYKENSNLKICFDCANGVTFKIIKRLFPKAKIIGGEVFVNKENEECGATHIENLKNQMKCECFDIGFSFDGDGDRLIVVLKDLTVLDGDDLLYLFAKYYKQKNCLAKNCVVGTILTNYGIEQSLNNLGIRLVRQNVGDKNICLEMKNKGYILGAEQSGHMIIDRGFLIGDAILLALEILSILPEIGDLKKYISEVKKFHQVNENVFVPENVKDYIMLNEELKDVVSNLENELGVNGRIVIRKSGTESVIRVLVEGVNKTEISSVIRIIKQKILDIIKIC